MLAIKSIRISRSSRAKSLTALFVMLGLGTGQADAGKFDDIVAPRPTIIGTQPESPYTITKVPMRYVRGMNETEMIIGLSLNLEPAVYFNGAVHLLEVPPGFSEVFVRAISSNGIIAGDGVERGRHRGLVWNRYDASPRVIIAKAGLYAQGVNASGTVVGHSGSFSDGRAFAWNAA